MGNFDFIVAPVDARAVRFASPAPAEMDRELAVTSDSNEGCLVIARQQLGISRHEVVGESPRGLKRCRSALKHRNVENRLGDVLFS
jgi:hypothetical protein